MRFDQQNIAYISLWYLQLRSSHESENKNTCNFAKKYHLCKMLAVEWPTGRGLKQADLKLRTSYNQLAVLWYSSQKD